MYLYTWGCVKISQAERVHEWKKLKKFVDEVMNIDVSPSGGWRSKIKV